MGRDKTETTLKSTALVAYRVHFMLLGCSDKYKSCLIYNEHSAVSFLPVTVGRDLKHSCFLHEGRSCVYWFPGTDEVHAEESRQFFTKGSEKMKKSLFHNGMMRILRLLVVAGSASF